MAWAKVSRSDTRSRTRQCLSDMLGTEWAGGQAPCVLGTSSGAGHLPGAPAAGAVRLGAGRVSGSPWELSPPRLGQRLPHQSCCGCWRGASGPWQARGGCLPASPWHRAPARASPGNHTDSAEEPYLAPAPPQPPSHRRGVTAAGAWPHARHLLPTLVAAAKCSAAPRFLIMHAAAGGRGARRAGPRAPPTGGERAGAAWGPAGRRSPGSCGGGVPCPPGSVFHGARPGGSLEATCVSVCVSWGRELLRGVCYVSVTRKPVPVSTRLLYELDGDPKRKEFLDDLFSFMQKRGTPVNRIPIMAKQVLDLFMLYVLVTEKGGLVEVINKKLWREITKGLNLPTSITSAAFTLRTQYMKYLYPYECEKRGLSSPNELQAAIDSNRREGRRQSFGGSLFAYSPGGAHGMLSSPKLPVPSLGLAASTNGSSGPPAPKIKKEEDSAIPITVPGRLPVSLTGHPVVAAQAAAVQAAAAQAAVAAQAAALEQLREKLESGEPPEKKMALVADEQHRLVQRALQQNFLAMTAQLPMSIRINSQACESRQDSAPNLTGPNGSNSISMSVEINGIMYTGVLFAQPPAPAPHPAPSKAGGGSGRGGNSGTSSSAGSQAGPAGLSTPATSSTSNNSLP
ncbi:AT-rich interactive domain-containing protein 3A isoform X1 [Meles meles]|uniref:AT-rich interactive domain-containing protein 3A isoform X1 n=1 Tax=Meles meles TaxID=9662 RepID=UPI001E69E0A1|nr:AT-rich interactive domain-containing protein 3A isoform X1 [Meles meles]